MPLWTRSIRSASCGVVFFFSSRRRHTRFDCDWSSDVCSSDLLLFLLVVPGLIAMRWFQLDDFPSRLGLVPGISFAMTITSAFLVKAVHRTPFSADRKSVV